MAGADVAGRVRAGWVQVRVFADVVRVRRTEAAWLGRLVSLGAR